MSPKLLTILVTSSMADWNAGEVAAFFAATLHAAPNDIGPTDDAPEHIVSFLGALRSAIEAAGEVVHHDEDQP